MEIVCVDEGSKVVSLAEDVSSRLITGDWIKVLRGYDEPRWLRVASRTFTVQDGKSMELVLLEDRPNATRAAP